jgi:hypothetical protein
VSGEELDATAERTYRSENAPSRAGSSGAVRARALGAEKPAHGVRAGSSRAKKKRASCVTRVATFSGVGGGSATKSTPPSVAAKTPSGALRDGARQQEPLRAQLARTAPVPCGDDVRRLPKQLLEESRPFHQPPAQRVREGDSPLEVRHMRKNGVHQVHGRLVGPAGAAGRTQATHLTAAEPRRT